MDNKEKEIIKRAVERDGYTPSCYRSRGTAAEMLESVAVMQNCMQLLRSEKDEQKLIKIIRENGIPISKKITDYLNERSDENEECAYMYMHSVLIADTYVLENVEHGVSYEITKEMYNFAVELHALK